jgi:hypothetical protein
VSDSRGVSDSLGVSASLGVSDSLGVSVSRGVSDSRGVSASLGVYASLGVSDSRGVSDSLGITGIFTAHKQSPFYIFGKEVSEERFIEVRNQIDKLWGDWYIFSAISKVHKNMLSPTDIGYIY